MHTFDLAESEQREIEGGNIDREAQAAYGLLFFYS